jgi:hypothetical protein
VSGESFVVMEAMSHLQGLGGSKGRVRIRRYRPGRKQVNAREFSVAGGHGDAGLMAC